MALLHSLKLETPVPQRSYPDLLQALYYANPEYPNLSRGTLRDMFS
jgi:hypothetical protein